MKTKFGVLTLLIIFFSSLVTAGPVQGIEQLAEGLKEVIVILIQFISDTIFNINSFDEFLFAKILLFSIIFMVTYSSIAKSKLISENRTINIIISVSISILAIRFLPDNDFINSMLLPYGAFGAAIVTFLPLAIFFFFVHENLKGTIIRRSAWIFYGAFFIGLWWMRKTELSEAVGWIYTGAFLTILFSIAFDKQIHKIWGMREISHFLTGAHERTIANLQAEYLQIASIDSSHAKNRRKFIEKKLVDLGGRIP